MSRRPLADRFWEKVDKNGPIPAACPELGPCWLWTAGRSRGGYGAFWMDGQLERANRVAWLLTNGPIGDGRWALHRCDVPACVNPTHLFLGDHRANMDDALAKSRMPHMRGMSNGRAKYDEATVAAVRERATRGATSRSIAKTVGMSEGHVGKIVRGRSRKDAS